MASLIMCKDIPVIRFSFDLSEEPVWEILKESLIPYQLKGLLKEIPEIKDGMSRQELNQLMSALNSNDLSIRCYLANRVLPITRENTKKIYGLFGFEQSQDIFSKSNIAIYCKSLSLMDDYWIKNDDDSISYDNVNLKHNPLNDIVTEVSLYGKSLDLTGSLITPELTGQGSYAKGWRSECGNLYLYKLGTIGYKDIEARIEVSVSSILDRCNVDHVIYELVDGLDGRVASKCLCMTTDNLSMMSGLDFYTYCSANNIDAYSALMKIDPDNIYKMWIVDYLISNPDRHGENWGLYYDSKTMEIKGCSPLFDHNRAFNEKVMKNKDSPYIFLNEEKSIREAAMCAIKKVDFYFKGQISPNLFVSQNHFQSFMERAKELNISIKK